MNAPARTRSLFLVAAAAVLICFFGHLGAMGLVGPDEPRYAWIAREMARTDDWVTPRLYGQPWFEKPVLYYWTAGLFFRLMQSAEAEWPARLPSAMAALLALLTVIHLARRHYGTQVAWGVAVILPTTLATMGFSHAASPDMLFSAALACTIAAAMGVLRSCGALRRVESASGPPQRGPLAWLLLFGAFLGTAVLAKGPAAMILAAGSMGLWALATRQWRAAVRLAHPVAIGAFAVVTLPWYALCAIRNPDFLRVFIWQHNFERFLTPVFQHKQPFWFYGPVLLLGMLPWTALLWPLALRAVRVFRERTWKDSPGFLLGCWAVFPVVFFSFSQSKLPGYILPVFPPLSLLAAASLIEGHKEKPRIAEWSTAAVGATLACMCALALVTRHGVLPEAISPGLLGALVGAGIAGGAVIVILAFRRPVLQALAVTGLLVASLVEFANLGILPKVDGRISARSVSRFILTPPQRSLPLFAYRLDRSWRYGASFYLEREVPEWGDFDDDRALPVLLLADPRELGSLRSWSNIAVLWDGQSRQCVLVELSPPNGSKRH